MGRRLVIPAAATAVAIAAVLTQQPVHAAPRGAVCEISGSATISPGLSTTAKKQSITLSGVRLTNCESGSAASPGVPKPLSGSVTTSPNPEVISASCASGNLHLSATIRWNNGTTTNASVSTTGVTASQTLNGKVTGSTNPILKSGDLLAGEVAFRPKSPTQDCVTPVKAVTFQGVIGTGAPN